MVSLLTEPNVLWGSTWIVAKEEPPFCCIAGKWLSLCEDASWWWKERVPQNFSLANLRLQILRGTGLPTTGKHWNNDIEAVPSTCSEKDCFSLAVENEVEVTWKSVNENYVISRKEVFCKSHVTVRKHAWRLHREITWYWVDSLLLTCELPIYLPESSRAAISSFLCFSVLGIQIPLRFCSLSSAREKFWDSVFFHHQEAYSQWLSIFATLQQNGPYRCTGLKSLRQSDSVSKYSRG